MYQPESKNCKIYAKNLIFITILVSLEHIKGSRKLSPRKKMKLLSYRMNIRKKFCIKCTDVFMDISPENFSNSVGKKNNSNNWTLLLRILKSIKTWINNYHMYYKSKTGCDIFRLQHPQRHTWVVLRKNAIARMSKGFHIKAPRVRLIEQTARMTTANGALRQQSYPQQY